MTTTLPVGYLAPLPVPDATAAFGAAYHHAACSCRQQRTPGARSCRCNRLPASSSGITDEPATRFCLPLLPASYLPCTGPRMVFPPLPLPYRYACAGTPLIPARTAPYVDYSAAFRCVSVTHRYVIPATCRSLYLRMVGCLLMRLLRTVATARTWFLIRSSYRLPAVLLPLKGAHTHWTENRTLPAGLTTTRFTAITNILY